MSASSPADRLLQTISVSGRELWLNVQLYFDDFAPHLNPSYPWVDHRPGDRHPRRHRRLAIGAVAWFFRSASRRRAAHPVVAVDAGPLAYSAAAVRGAPCGNDIAIDRRPAPARRATRRRRSVIALVALVRPTSRSRFADRRIRLYTNGRFPAHMSPTWYLPNYSRL